MIFLLLLRIAMAVPSPDYHAIAFDEQAELSLRWKSFMKLIEREDGNRIKHIDRALASKDWFMRDAGLKALVMTDSSKAKLEARTILKKDPSLIVRTSAVEALRVLKDKDARSDLWDAFSDQKNFRKKQSLWIRPKILTALIELGDTNPILLKKALKDRDPKVQRIASFGLKKVDQKDNSRSIR